MTSQILQAKVYFSDGTVGLLNGTDGDGGVNTDGTLGELKTDKDFYVVASSIGTQFPGRTIISADCQAQTFLSYAYILDRSGNIGAMIPPTSQASGQPSPVRPLAAPYTLQPGDTFQTMTAA